MPHAVLRAYHTPFCQQCGRFASCGWRERDDDGMEETLVSRETYRRTVHVVADATLPG